ncbi:hypothetical protein FPV67DRAFT_1456431 [Lyophyllum atratum]|nr:hypothetical protein FPV67DRAFT_1456431 [Lyophyllum atratum]
MPLIPKPRRADREGFPLIQVPIERRLSVKLTRPLYYAASRFLQRGTPVRIRLGSKREPGVFIGYRWRKAGARAHRRELRAMGIGKLPKAYRKERIGICMHVSSGWNFNKSSVWYGDSNNSNAPFTPTQKGQGSTTMHWDSNTVSYDGTYSQSEIRVELRLGKDWVERGLRAKPNVRDDGGDTTITTPDGDRGPRAAFRLIPPLPRRSIPLPENAMDIDTHRLRDMEETDLLDDDDLPEIGPDADSESDSD